MPSKAASLITFLLVFLVSTGLHRFVYVNLRGVLLRDYPRLGPRLVRYSAILFILMDSPFIFLFFRNKITSDVTVLNRILIYPFSVWQAVMLIWALILIPFLIWRRGLRPVAGRIAVKYKRRGKDEGQTENSEFEPVLEMASD